MKALISAVALSLAAGTASAAVYDYTGSQNPGGPALSCSAFGFLNNSCSVTYNPAGLGVNGSPDTQPDQIDGNPILSGERLTFDFGYNVTWNTLTFGNWDRNDDAQFSFADSLTSTWGPNAGSSANLGNVVSQYMTVTAFGVPFADRLGNDSFSVASIEVSSVPVPAAGLMLLMGLGGIAGMRRRRKAA